MPTRFAPQPPRTRSRSPLFAHTNGAGDAVLCLHSSAGSHAQWRSLGAALSGRCELIAPDLHGHGRSPGWPAGAAHPLHLDAHGVAALLPSTHGDSAPPGAHLVGHSYGAAVALQVALQQPRSVRSLTLYEPVPFGVIRSAAPGDAGLGEIEEIAGSVEALVRRGDLEGAARIFVGYWGGASAWKAMNSAQRDAVFARITNVPRHFDALLRATWTPRLLASLTMPVLLIHGAATRAPARRVAALLAAALPQSRRVEIGGAGHLGPMTHPTEVNAAIVRHLAMHGAGAAPARTRGAAIA